MTEATKRSILAILAENNRLSPEDIASMLNLSMNEVTGFITDMEESKVILKYNTLINWEKAGEEMVSALIDVKVTPQRGLGFDVVAERIYRFPEVISVYLMSGGYDLSVLIEGKSMKDVALFVAEKLATIEHVQATTTHFVLKKYKQDGVIFEDKEEDRRLVVSP
ncbi:MAG TPA: Lrp/AsnC family transcriptional regulator [Candidatus Deferrimicrobium sp.]|nr:Lrp/AsnC family transcriptional regulator [Candidatus Deferrimicrobium sp.]